MTIDSRVIEVLAKRAPNVTVVQAQNICQDLLDMGALEGIKWMDVAPADDSPVELTTEQADELIQKDRAEIKRLRKMEQFIMRCGLEKQFEFWLTTRDAC